MPKIPNITIQGWTEDGPAYTTHRRPDGWRNRDKRRAGETDDTLIGPHWLLGTDQELDADRPFASMVWAVAETEAWAFRGGHAYRVELLVDGDAAALLVDARDADRIETYGEDLELLEWRGLTGDELEQVLGGTMPQPDSHSDGAESQDPLPVQEEQPPADGVLTGAETHPDSIAEVDVPEPLIEPAPESELEVHAEEPAYATTPENLATGEWGPGEPAPAAPEAAESTQDDDEPSEASYDGTVEEFKELAGAMTDDELTGFAHSDHRVTLREAAAGELAHRAQAASQLEGDSEDAVTGDGAPTSEEEE